MGWLQDETGLERCAANYAPLTPLSHLRRAADLFAQRDAIVYGTERRELCRVSRTRVAACIGAGRAGGGRAMWLPRLLPNIPAHAEAHFGVPACGAVLNAINTRLDVDTVQYSLRHGAAQSVLVDSALLDVAEAACATLDTPPLLVEVPDAQAGFAASGGT